MERPLPFQDVQLAAGVVAQEAEVWPEQPEEVVAPPTLRVSLQHGAGRPQVGP